MPRRIILVAIFALLTLAVPTHADDSSAWTAWLHYGRHMTLIDSDGHTLRELDLPVPEGYDSGFTHYREVGISPDGNWAAYRLWGYPQPDRLQVIDLATNTAASSYPVTGLEGMSISPPNNQMFAESGDSLVVGYAPSPRDLHLDVLSTRTGQALYSVDTTANSLGLTPVQNIFRVFTLRYGADKVNFAIGIIEPDSEDIDNEQGTSEIWSTRYFIWILITGDIQPDTIFSNLESNDFPATGEIVATAYNPLFPVDPYELGEPPFENTLQVFDPTLNAVFPFYQADNVIPRNVFFVQNGTRILAYLFHYADLTYDDVTSYWTLLERDGTIVDEWALPENLQIDEIKNTPDGFMYTASLKPTDEWNWEQPIPAVYEVDTRDNTLDTGRLVWQIPMKTFRAYFGNSLPYFDIAWVHSEAPVGPFKPWAQLADPVYAPTPEPSTATITPTSLPTPPPLFYVGQTVRVQTIDGEILNLRAAPTRKSDILVYIEDDTLLELLEGPVEAEGFHWWRVHTPDGLAGWVVENDGEVQTILPE